MFKLTVPITKSTTTKDGKLLVRGVASDPSIDKDNERFDVSAIDKMKKDVNEKSLPIRVEHENKIYTDIGTWTLADVTKDNKMIVEGEIDTELSLGKDIRTLLKRGVQMALSVGGKVIDAGFEYSKELGKNIKVYKDVCLEEISVVKNPANCNATLSLAKSVDWNKLESISKTNDKQLPYTTKAQELITHYKSMEKVSPEEYEKAVLTTAERNKLPDASFGYVMVKPDGSKVRKLPIHDAAHVKNALAVLGGARGGVKGIPPSDMPKVKAKVEAAAKKFKVGQYAAKKSATERTTWGIDVETQVMKIFNDMPFDKDYDVEVEEAPSLSAVDMQAIAQMTNIMSNVDLPSDDEVEAMWEDQNYMDTIDVLGEDGYVILSNRAKVMPHHNVDYTLNKDWVLFQLKRLVDGRGYWTPKDFTVILSHFYSHLKELAVVKSQKDKAPAVAKAPALPELSVIEFNALKQAYEFVKGGCKTSLPEIEGEVIKDEQKIQRMALAFEKLQKHPDFINLSNLMDMKQDIKKEEGASIDPNAAEVTPEAEVPAETVETPVEETPAETPAAEPVVEEVSEGGEEVTPEVAPEGEAPAEAPTEETPAADPADGRETVPAEVPAAEVVEETVPQPVEAPVAEPAAEPAPAPEAPAEEPAPVADTEVEKSADSFNKALSQLTDVVGDLVEKAKVTEGLQKSIADLTEIVNKHSQIVDKLAQIPMGRKSIATYQALEKTMSGSVSEEAKTFEERLDKYLDEGLEPKEAYMKAKSAQ